MARIHPDRLRSLIRYTLQQMAMYSASAEVLLLGTAAQESHLGHWLMQYPHGPGRGLYQMEPDTEYDIWMSYLFYRKERTQLIKDLTGVGSPSPMQLQFNHVYSTAMARLHYRRIKAPLPQAGDLPALAGYWKAHYNTVKGKGTPSEFMENFKKLVGRPESHNPEEMKDSSSGES